jgi:hypothetical protein
MTTATATKQNTKIKVGPFTGAYAQGLFQASAVNDGDEPKYGITLLIPKATADKNPSFVALKKMIEVVGKTKFGPNYVKLCKHLPIRDGDVEKPDKKEFAGMYFIRAGSKSRPQVVNRHLVPVTDKEDAYSGCKYVVSMNVFAFEHKVGGKGVSLGLNNAMVWEKGERIDGKVDAAEDFAEFADGDTGSAPAAGGDENPLD